MGVVLDLWYVKISIKASTKATFQCFIGEPKEKELKRKEHITYEKD